MSNTEEVFVNDVNELFVVARKILKSWNGREDMLKMDNTSIFRWIDYLKRAESELDALVNQSEFLAVRDNHTKPGYDTMCDIFKLTQDITSQIRLNYINHLEYMSGIAATFQQRTKKLLTEAMSTMPEGEFIGSPWPAIHMLTNLVTTLSERS